MVGFAKACEICNEEFDADIPKMTAVRDRIIDGILEKIPEVYLNGHRTQRLPNNINVGIRYIEGEGILLNLDMLGLSVSTGSACSSKSLEPSHVLLACGDSHEEAHGSVRITISRFTTDEEVDYLLEHLPPVVDKLRKMSPLYPGGNE
jgi:cysteine desulfurase